MAVPGRLFSSFEYSCFRKDIQQNFSKFQDFSVNNIARLCILGHSAIGTKLARKEIPAG